MNKYEGIMYHGTDKNILRMGEQERKRRLELCNEMADYAYGFLKSKNLCVVLKSQLSEPDKEKLGDIWNDLRNFGMTKYEGANYRTAISLEKALELAQSLFPQKEIFICGGEAVYREAITLKLPERLYITEIDADIPGDAFFPDFDKNDFEIKDKTKIDSPIPHCFIECHCRT